MKKSIKFFGKLLLIVVVLILFAGLYIQLRGIPSYKTEKIEFVVQSTPESIARGEKLAKVLCANCHFNEETGQLTGKFMRDAPEEFGKIYSANITKDETHGIGTWTDSEIVYLLRTGIKRDGKYAPPYMAKLPTMADDDINAIVSFLRSDHSYVRANATPSIPVEPSFLTKVLSNTVFKPFPFPEQKIPMPDENNPIELGKYLAHNLDCFSCHSADFKTNDFLEPEKSPGYFGGGNELLNMEGQVIHSSNLTPDKETGIGKWSKEKFRNALKSGIVEGEIALRYPMVPYVNLTDNEIDAIYTYLQSLPAIENKVPR
ncbi:c-type cytochrome [Namhaeicola litoreus]|uniref:C-type cytochrome n=1 Tax=Namhaeicola litoreus TaxID=1052145 RepID=A0ABW3Y5N3_9FLAO